MRANEHRNYRGVDLHIPFQYGVDSDIPKSPRRGDAYFAYDTMRLYVCHRSGTWSYTPFTSKDLNAFNISVDGIVNFNKQSSFYVYLSSNQSISANTWTKVQWDTVKWDIQNEVDLNAHTFSPKQSGIYRSTFLVYLVANAGDSIRLAVKVNDEQVLYYRNYFATNVAVSLPLDGLLRLHTDDIVHTEIRISSSNTLLSYSSTTFWCMNKVS